MFNTIGKVERAEIQYEPNGRSRGTGVVLFDTAENAETAICIDLDAFILSDEFGWLLILAKFTGYLYGGRPLGLSYVKYNSFGSNGADAMEGAEPALTQDQMMWNPE